MIEEVEAFRAELAVDAFLGKEVLEQRCVDLLVTWPREVVAPNAAEGAERSRNEGCGVEPLLVEVSAGWAARGLRPQPDRHKSLPTPDSERSVPLVTVNGSPL